LIPWEKDRDGGGKADFKNIGSKVWEEHGKKEEIEKLFPVKEIETIEAQEERCGGGTETCYLG
jgi:hypothetical protein